MNQTTNNSIKFFIVENFSRKMCTTTKPSRTDSTDQSASTGREYKLKQCDALNRPAPDFDCGAAMDISTIIIIIFYNFNRSTIKY
jgi:hypothetical protein